MSSNRFDDAQDHLRVESASTASHGDMIRDNCDSIKTISSSTISQCVPVSHHRSTTSRCRRRLALPTLAAPPSPSLAPVSAPPGPSRRLSQRSTSHTPVLPTRAPVPFSQSFFSPLLAPPPRLFWAEPQPPAGAGATPRNPNLLLIPRCCCFCCWRQKFQRDSYPSERRGETVAVAKGFRECPLRVEMK